MKTILFALLLTACHDANVRVTYEKDNHVIVDVSGSSNAFGNARLDFYCQPLPSPDAGVAAAKVAVPVTATAPLRWSSGNPVVIIPTPLAEKP